MGVMVRDATVLAKGEAPSSRLAQAFQADAPPGALIEATLQTSPTTIKTEPQPVLAPPKAEVKDEDEDLAPVSPEEVANVKAEVEQLDKAASVIPTSPEAVKTEPEPLPQIYAGIATDDPAVSVVQDPNDPLSRLAFIESLKSQVLTKSEEVKREEAELEAGTTTRGLKMEPLSQQEASPVAARADLTSPKSVSSDMDDEALQRGLLASMGTGPMQPFYQKQEEMISPGLDASQRTMSSTSSAPERPANLKREERPPIGDEELRRKNAKVAQLQRRLEEAQKEQQESLQRPRSSSKQE